MQFNPENSALIIKGIRDYVKESGHNGVVIGVSGGIDSAVCLALAERALGKKNVLGLIMPDGKGASGDLTDAITVCKKAGARYEVMDISKATGALEALVNKPRGKRCTRIDSGNIAARTRMMVLYNIAACKKYLVLGTGNKTELLLGYFTKHGDGGADLLPIGDLYKKEVKELAKWLKVPEKIIKKTPSAGLWNGQTDEGELGFTYGMADRILPMFVEEGMNGRDIIRVTGNAGTVKKIFDMVSKTSHKRAPPRIFSLALGRWR